MPYSVMEAVELGNRVLDAYTLYTSNGSTLVLPAGYSLVNTVYADDITDLSDEYVIFGFIARSANDLLVAIRGTEGVVEWAWDFDFGLTTFPFANAGRTEAGFTNFYDTFRTGTTDASPRVIDALRGLFQGGFTGSLRIAGHSLGSALATLLAIDLALNAKLNPTVYTFGSPFVGDGNFAQAYNGAVPNNWRIANHDDIVTDVPPSLIGYVHVNTLVPIDSAATAKQKPSCRHQLRTYLHTLDAHVTLDAGCLPGSPPTIF